ncbi:MAG: APC family permease [Pseudomonadota bacterium]
MTPLSALLGREFRTGPDMEPTSLRRVISLPLLILYGLGTMLGAGIYALIGEVAGEAGVLAPWSFVAAAVLAGLTGLSFAEFSSRLPKAAGEAAYVNAGFPGAPLALIVGLLVATSGVVSAGVMLDSFVGYSGAFFAAPAWLKTLSLTLFIGAVAAWGIAESLAIVALVTVLEVGALLVVVTLGIAAPTHDVPMPTTAGNLVGVLSGTVLAFYAFIGFEDMVNVAEEVRRPRRTVPIAIFVSIGVAAALYAVVAIVAVRVVSTDALAASPEPMALILSSVSSIPPIWMNAVAIVALVNGALVQVVMASRVLFGLADRNLLPKSYAVVNQRTKTPLRATLLVCLLIFAASAMLPLGTLAKLTSLVLLIVFTLINIALIRVKRRKSEDGQAFEVFEFLPWIAAIGTSGLAVVSMVSLVR